MLKNGSQRNGVRRALLSVFQALVLLAAVVTPDAAAALCHPTTDRPAPFGATPCEGVRPGAVLVNSPAPVLPDVVPDGHCTMGFLFRSGRERYVSTAGHCSGVAEGTEAVWGRGEGPEVHDGDGRRIGQFIYAVVDGRPGVYLDFGLVRLDRDVDANPTVCHFGGPSAINDDTVPATDPVALPYYGATLAGAYVPGARRWVLPARTGIAAGLTSTRRAMFNGHASFGDSGAPLLSRDGRAVGLISGPGDADAANQVGLVYAPRLAPQLAMAESALRRKLRLWVGRGSGARV